MVGFIADLNPRLAFQDITCLFQVGMRVRTRSGSLFDLAERDFQMLRTVDARSDQATIAGAGVVRRRLGFDILRPDHIFRAPRHSASSSGQVRPLFRASLVTMAPSVSSTGVSMSTARAKAIGA